MKGDPGKTGMSAPIKVRAATSADLPAILAIEQQAPAASHWSAKEYERIVAEQVLLVAEGKQGLAGFICAKHAAGEWEIENIAVAPDYRRCGIAGELLGACIAQVRPGSAMFLEVRDSNLPARRFYEKHGFAEVGRRRSYYQQPEEDAVVYELRVAS